MGKINHYTLQYVRRLLYVAILSVFLLFVIMVPTSKAELTSTFWFEAPFVSMIDGPWANKKMLGIGSEPIEYTFSTGGCMHASLSMIMQYFAKRESSLSLYQNSYGDTANPDGIDFFFSEMKAKLECPDAYTGLHYDFAPLSNWSRWYILNPHREFYTGLRSTGAKWSLKTRNKVDETLLLYQEPVLLHLAIPDGEGGTIQHYVVAIGWNDFDKSYMVHDPLNHTQRSFNTTALGAPILAPAFSLHDLYAYLPGVDDGALNIITDVFFFEFKENGSLDTYFKVTACCPVELFVSDPEGKRVGIDPVSGAYVEEADDSYYVGQGFSSPFDPVGLANNAKEVQFSSPKEGKYHIQIIGTGDGPFELFINNGEQRFNGVIEKGEIRKVEVTYNSDGIVAEETSNFLPTARASTDISVANTGVPVWFSASSSTDIDGTIESYRWNYGDNSEGFGSTVEHSYLQPGNYTVTLTVEDGQNGVSFDTLNILIESSPPPFEPQPPSVTIAQRGWSGTTTPSGPYIGLASTEPSNQAYVHFHAYGVNPDGGSQGLWRWKWDFGDGSDPVETSQWAYSPIGVSGVDHEYQFPGTYSVSVIFNNGIEDSPPATTTVEVFPALTRDDGQFNLNSSCYIDSSSLGVSGRLFYNSNTGLRLTQMWNGGLSLGLQSLKDWLDQDFYFVVTTAQQNEFWVLGEIQIQLPDLSFEHKFPIPDLYDGDYIAYIYPGEWSPVGFNISEFPFYMDYWPSEGGIQGAMAGFSIPCPPLENLPPIVRANGPYVGSVGLPITLDGSGSYDPDGDGDKLTFEWLVPGYQDALVGLNPEVVFNDPGEYIVALRVEDAQGATTYPSIGSPSSFASVTVSEEVPNNPPVCDAGPDVSVSSENQNEKIIIGTAFDSDGDHIIYRWLEGGSELSPWQDVVTGNIRLYLSELSPFVNGQHAITLEVRDAYDTISDHMTLTIENSVPHTAPTGGGIYNVNTSVNLGGQVSDFDGDVVTYDWLDGESLLYSGVVQTVYGGGPVVIPNFSTSSLHLGEHTLILRVSDGVNAPIEASLSIEIKDTTAPQLAPVPDKSILWPPNHKMVDVRVQANASDNSMGTVTLAATVSSNEAQNSLEDGDLAPDWTDPIIDQVDGTLKLQLRAERSGSGDGRVYTLTITATDEFGNTSSSQIEIIVPHDKGGS